jgi:hypothetical protein
LFAALAYTVLLNPDSIPFSSVLRIKFDS